MGELAKNYPDDLDAATLYAESMMNLRPWKLWTLDGKPAEDTLEIVSVLEECVASQSESHAARITTTFTRSKLQQMPSEHCRAPLVSGKIAPKAGHLVHMPSHIYIRTGDYYQAAQSNVDAIAVDREYITKSGNNGLYPAMYYNHNIHFLAAASAMKGRYADSIKVGARSRSECEAGC